MQPMFAFLSTLFEFLLVRGLANIFGGSEGRQSRCYGLTFQSPAWATGWFSGSIVYPIAIVQGVRVWDSAPQQRFFGACLFSTFFLDFDIFCTSFLVSLCTISWTVTCLVASDLFFCSTLTVVSVASVIFFFTIKKHNSNSCSGYLHSYCPLHPIISK